MFTEYTPDFSKNKSNDRVLKLALIDDKAPISTTGLVDKRLFTGENVLHCVMDVQSSLWSFKYDSGILPQPLRNTRFTSFSKARQYAEDYFNKRNIKINEVIE